MDEKNGAGHRLTFQRLPYQEKRNKLSDRKTYLYTKYQRMLQDSEVVIALDFANVNVPLMREIRRQMHSVKVPAEEITRLEALQGGQPWDLPVATLSLARTGILRPVCREHPEPAVRQLGERLRGQIALLTCPVLSPEYLGRVLRAIERPLASARDEAQANNKLVPRLAPLVCIAERSRFIDASGLPELTKLPTLSTLRAQLVGLLSMPGQQLAGVLSQASGGALSLALEGRRRDLEKGSSDAKAE